MDIVGQVDADEEYSFAQILVERIASLQKPMSPEIGACEICKRRMRLTKHHLTPKFMHSRLKQKGRSREELSKCAMICKICHTAVHHFFSEKVLATEYNTIDKLIKVESFSSMGICLRHLCIDCHIGSTDCAFMSVKFVHHAGRCNLGTRH